MQQITTRDVRKRVFYMRTRTRIEDCRRSFCAFSDYGVLCAVCFVLYCIDPEHSISICFSNLKINNRPINPMISKVCSFILLGLLLLTIGNSPNRERKAQTNRRAKKRRATKELLNYRKLFIFYLL